MDNGEGQHWNTSPGNLISTPFKITISENEVQAFDVVLDKIIPEIEEPQDTEWVKHIKMKSDLLSEFWGRDMYLGAHVLLPKGFNDHPEAKYPLMVFQGHFPYDFGGFRTTPPDKNLKPDYSDRFGVKGYNIMQQQEAYDFYKRWNEPDFPRFLIIEIQHPTPYYDDSYAVKSASQGPYGDALTYELIPYIEKKFRGQGTPESRFVEGCSTGGWVSLALQLFYPDFFGGCFSYSPDQVDFENCQLINIYKDDNAFYNEFGYLRPIMRDVTGEPIISQKDFIRFENVLGRSDTYVTSGGQFSAFTALFSPKGEDGLPKPLFDPKSGKIDHEVAEYWRKHDLKNYVKTHWKTLGPKIQGKIWIWGADMDNFYLNPALRAFDAMLHQMENPKSDAVITFTPMARHCQEYNDIKVLLQIKEKMESQAQQH